MSEDLPHSAVSGALARLRYGKWISFPHPDSPTGFFRPRLHGIFKAASSAELLVEVLAGPSPGLYRIEKEDAKSSGPREALKSYAPLSETEAFALSTRLTDTEVSLLGELMDEGEMSQENPPTSFLGSPAAATIAAAMGGVAVTYLMKRYK